VFVPRALEAVGRRPEGTIEPRRVRQKPRSISQLPSNQQRIYRARVHQKHLLVTPWEMRDCRANAICLQPRRSSHPEPASRTGATVRFDSPSSSIVETDNPLMLQGSALGISYGYVANSQPQESYLLPCAAFRWSVGGTATYSLDFTCGAACNFFITLPQEQRGFIPSSTSLDATT
jgi:hypothetical protein